MRLFLSTALLLLASAVAFLLRSSFHFFPALVPSNIICSALPSPMTLSPAPPLPR